MKKADITENINSRVIVTTSLSNIHKYKKIIVENNIRIAIRIASNSYKLTFNSAIFLFFSWFATSTKKRLKILSNIKENFILHFERNNCEKSVGYHYFSFKELSLNAIYALSQIRSQKYNARRHDLIYACSNIINYFCHILRSQLSLTIIY